MLSSMFGGKKKKKATKSRASTSSTGAKGKKKKQAAPVTRTKRVTKSLAFTDSAGDDDDDDDDAASITKSIGGRSTASKSRGKKMKQKKQLPSPSPAPPLQSKSLAGVPPREQTPRRARTKGDRELGRSKARLPRRGSDDDGESKGVDVGRSKRVASGLAKSLNARKASSNTAPSRSSPKVRGSGARRAGSPDPDTAAVVIQSAWLNARARRAQADALFDDDVRQLSEAVNDLELDEEAAPPLAQQEAPQEAQQALAGAGGGSAQRRAGRAPVSEDFEGDPLYEWLKTVRLPDLLRPLHDLGVHEPLDLTDLEPQHVDMLGLKPVRKSRFMRAVTSLQTQAEGASAQAVDTAAAAAGATAIRPSELKLGKEIGTGSYGVVYSGRWRGTQVAVKILRASLSHAAMESAAAEIVRELNTMRRVGNHRHIVSLLGICHLQFPARLAIVTDYMARGSLLDVLKGKTGDPPTDIKIVQMAAQVAAGIAHLHRENVVHRDLAARNVLVDQHYNLRVGDFGFARVLSDPVDVGVTSSNVGPVRWMAPQCLRRRQYSTASDVWAFGVLLYEMVTRGREPWEGMGLMEVGSKVLGGETLQPYLPRDTDPVLADIAIECWRFDPDQRPGMMDVCHRLQEHHGRLRSGMSAHVSAAAAAAARAAAVGVARDRELAAAASESKARVPVPDERGYDPFFSTDRVPPMPATSANLAPAWSGGLGSAPQYTEGVGGGGSVPSSASIGTPSSGTLSRDSTDVAGAGGGRGGAYVPPAAMPERGVPGKPSPRAQMRVTQQLAQRNQQQQQQQQHMYLRQYQQQYVPRTFGSSQRLDASPSGSLGAAPTSARPRTRPRRSIEAAGALSQANMAAGPPQAVSSRANAIPGVARSIPSSAPVPSSAAPRRTNRKAASKVKRSKR